MKRSQTQFARLQELDRQMRGKKYPNCTSFAADWQVSGKTVQRDIDFLRDQLRAPIEYSHEKRGYYYTESNWFLPSLNLTEGDLFSLLIAARALEPYAGSPVGDDLRQVFRKIAASLPDGWEGPPEFLFNRFTFRPPPSLPVRPATWTVIVRGLLTMRTVKVRYKSSRSPTPKERILDPYHIANLEGEWYVLAFDHERKEVMQYLIGSIQRARLTQSPFKIVDDFDPDKIMGNTFGRFAEDRDLRVVKVLIREPMVQFVQGRTWHKNQELEERKNGDVVISFPVSERGHWPYHHVVRWVLSWGRNATVLAPARLKALVDEEVSAMAERGRNKQGRTQPR